MVLNRSWIFGTISVVLFVGLACLLAFVIPETCLTCNQAKSACYRAAVFDHVQQRNTKGEDRRADIELNLQMVLYNIIKYCILIIKPYLSHDNV